MAVQALAPPIPTYGDSGPTYGDSGQVTGPNGWSLMKEQFLGRERMRAKTWSCTWELVHKALGSQGMSRERTLVCWPPARSPHPVGSPGPSPSQTRLWLFPGRVAG